MNIEEKIEGVIHKLKESPLKERESELDRIYNELILLKYKLHQPLKIGFIGEVKAGKSTLLNVFAGDSISPTNVAEATACIMSVHYGIDRVGSVIYTDGKTESHTIEYIYDILDKNRNKREFFSNIEYIDISIPLKGLKKVTLVDTPGIATITSDNEMLTKNYFQNIDVILWVLNGNYLGQMEVNEGLRQVAKMGKPVIAVINRIDEVDGDVEDLIDYVEDTLGIYVKSVKAVSALKAFEAIKLEDEEGIIASGYRELYDYIDKNIERKNELVKLESIDESYKALCRQLQFIHVEHKKELQFLLENYNSIENNIELSALRIRDNIKNEVSYWVNTDFLRYAQNDLLSEAGDRIWKGNISDEEIVKNINDRIARDIKKEIKEYCERVQEKFKSDWEHEMLGLNLKMAELYKAEFMNREKEYNLLTNSNQSTVLGGTFSKAVAMSGLVGGALATSLASQAYSFTAAFPYIFSFFLPTMLVVGTGAGVVGKYLQNKKMKERYQYIVKEMLNDVRKDVEKNLHAGIDEFVNVVCKDTITQSKETFANTYLKEYSVEEAQIVVKKLDNYPSFIEENR